MIYGRLKQLTNDKQCQMNPFEVLLGILRPQGKDNIVKQERYVEEADQGYEGHQKNLEYT